MIIFVYGTDTFRSRRKLKELKDKFLREVDPLGSSLSVLDGEKLSLDKLNEAAGAASLLSRKRMIVVEKIFARKDEAFYKELLVYIKTKKLAESDNIFVIWDDLAAGEKVTTKAKKELFAYFLEQKFAQEFKSMNALQAAAWVKAEIEARGGSINRDALSTLVAMTGGDLWQLDQEINKLVNYKAAQMLGLSKDNAAGVISVSDVTLLVHGAFDENIFALTDAISNRNKALAMKLFEQELEGGATEDYLLNMITRQFRILLQVRQALDSGVATGKLAGSLKIHPFVAQKAINQVRGFSLESLKKIFSRLLEIDYRMKSGKGNIRTALDLLMAKL